jgi:hypothetical protein
MRIFGCKSKKRRVLNARRQESLPPPRASTRFISFSWACATWRFSSAYAIVPVVLVPVVLVQLC